MSKIVDLTGLSRFWANVDKKKASIDGTYPNLVSGDLAGRGESVPAEFGFRASGGKSIKDGRAYIKRIKGNSVVWNQKAEKTYIDQDRVLHNIDIIPQNHKFALIRSKAFGGCYYMPSDGVIDYALTDGEYAKIFVQSHVADAEYSRIYSTAESGYIQLIDLTQLFQAGNEPTTIEEYEARKPIVADEYAYNEGQVIHCNTESIKSVGDNAVSWDYDFVTDNNGKPSDAKNYEEGKIYVGCSNSGYVNPSCIKTYEHYGNGIKVASSNGYGVGVFVKVLPNAQYYAGFNMNGNGGVYVTWYDAEKRLISHEPIANGASVTSTENTKYALILLIPYYEGVNEIVVTDFLFSLVHSGWKQDTDAGYQPYWQDTLPLPVIRKYFPDGMKKAGSAHDEIRFNKTSGKWEYSKGKIKSVDLGTLKFTLSSTGIYYCELLASAMKDAKYGFNLLCARYTTHRGELAPAALPDKSLMLYNGATYPLLGINDTAYTDAASFKAMLQEKPVKLYYESNDWEWVELDAEDQNFRDYYNVADFGTEQSQSSVPSAPFSADIIYQFNAVDMIREHEIEINELQSIIATMQAQLASLTSNNG